MQRADDGKTAVVLLAPKTADFEITRPTLLPGLLRTMESNKSQPLPIKMFEVSDVCVQCPDTDTGATNLRRLAALQTGTRNDDGTYGSGLELTIGLLDHIMLKLGALHRSVASADAPPRGGVYVPAAPLHCSASLDVRKQLPHRTLRRRRCLFPRPQRADHPQRQVRSCSPCTCSLLQLSAHMSFCRIIGVIGVVHPVVTSNFSVPFACSGLEMDIEGFSLKK